MTAAALLREIEHRGARAEINPNGQLRVAPRSRVSDLEPEIRSRARELAAAVAPYRIVVDQRHPVAVPVELRPGVKVIDVDLCIRAELGRLGTLAGLRAENRADPRAVRALDERIDDALETLATCGVVARLEPVQ